MAPHFRDSKWMWSHNLFPRDKTLHGILGIPQDKLVILYVVDRLDNRRKGLGLLREALQGEDQTNSSCTLGQAVAIQDLACRMCRSAL